MLPYDGQPMELNGSNNPDPHQRIDNSMSPLRSLRFNSSPTSSTVRQDATAGGPGILRRNGGSLQSPHTNPCLSKNAGGGIASAVGGQQQRSSHENPCLSRNSRTRNSSVSGGGILVNGQQQQSHGGSSSGRQLRSPTGTMVSFGGTQQQQSRSFSTPKNAFGSLGGSSAVTPLAFNLDFDRMSEENRQTGDLIRQLSSSGDKTTAALAAMFHTMDQRTQYSLQVTAQQ